MALTENNRPSWDEYFMTLANQVASRTTCMRRGVGAVIVKDRRILATGYNGVPSGLRHCAETGCLRQELGIPSGQRHEICRGLHAEQNAIIQAARYGINIEGASIYINTQPCVVCAKMLINAGIKEIIYQNPYPDELAMELLEESGIKMRVFSLDSEGGEGAHAESGKVSEGGEAAHAEGAEGAHAEGAEGAHAENAKDAEGAPA